MSLARLAGFQQHSAATAGLLTKRTARACRRGRHLQAEASGAVLSLDTSYVGKLKGVGKVWQITACDVASSFGWARVVRGEVTPAAVIRFLGEVPRPTYRDAGWRWQRVLTDGGKEFKATFPDVCACWGVRHTRTRPRHAWTNGVVKRFQGTILHEHWRIAFRRQYFTGLRMLQHSLDGFVRFSNHQRSHRGHRLLGRTPATIFLGVTPK